MTNTKKVFFAIAIAAIATLSFSVMQSAEANTEKSYGYNDVVSAIRDITPYVALDENGLVEFTTPVKEIPLDSKTIEIAEDYITLQNSFIRQARDNPNERPELDEKLTEKFSDFVKEIKDTEIRSGIMPSGLAVLLPEAYAAWGDVCGGSIANPHPVPPIYSITVPSGTARDHLINNGYHLVEGYASLNDGNDYAKHVSAYGCSNGEMRTQGIVTSSTTYSHQSPEPNPEVLSYPSPAWWWALYVAAWHVQY